MNCPECKKEVPDLAAACPHCGCRIDVANEIVLHVGAVTFTNADKKVAAAGIAGTVAGSLIGGLVGHRLSRASAQAISNMGKNGHGVLTDRRFVFGNSRPLKKISQGGAVSFAEYRRKGDIDFDIPLADIIAVSESKQGLSSLFVIEIDDMEYKFALLKKAQLPEWIAAFNKALGKPIG